jgi:hypothetical protein
MNAEEYEWIGVISPDDVKVGVTFITPLAFYNQEGIWEDIPPDARRQWFPNNGKAVIFEKNFPLTKTNQLRLFRPERNRQITDAYSNTYGYSCYLVSSNLQSPQLAQIFDWTARANNSFDMSDVLDQGIPVEDCYCQRVYIYCQSRLFGPIRLERDADRDIYRPREFIQSSNTGGQSLFVWMYTKPEDGTITLTDTHRRLMLLDESFLDTPTGKEDWSLPQVTIKQVLLASNEALGGFEDNVHLVDKRIRDLVRLSSQEGPHVLHLDATTLKRAHYILTNQVDRVHELRDIIGQLSAEHPVVKIARQIEIQVRSQELEREAAALIREQQQQLVQLQSETHLAQEQLQQLQSAAEETQRSQQQAILAMNAFEQTIHERLALLKEEPLRFLAEQQITALLLPMLVDGSVQPAFEMRIPPPDSFAVQNSYDAHSQEIPSISGLEWSIQDESELIKASLHALLQRWRRIAQQSGVNSKVVRICIATLLAGLVPVLDGDAAIATFRTLAQIVTRGRATVVPIPLTALTMLDLFGTLDQYQHAFIPSNGLADCILEAQAHPNELVIVVLEGIDRVPGMPTYIPLLRQYIEMSQHRISTLSSTPLPLFHPRAVARNDPYLALAQFKWPGNVLLTATFDNELHSLSMPSLCDRWTVHWEAIFKESAAFSHRTASTYSSAALELWKTWRDEVYANSVNNKDFHGSLNQRQKLLFSALTLLEIQDEDMLNELIWPDQFQQDEVEEGIV